MSQHGPLDTQALKELADLLSRAPRVVKLGRSSDGSSVEDIASEAAAGLTHIRRSTDVLFNELLPRLKSLAPESSDFEDTLDDIAEEYRHMNHHIANTRLFSYVVPRK